MPRLRLMPFALAVILTIYSLTFLVYALVKTRIPHAAPANSALPKLASLSETSSLRTARNNLTLNLGDGREVISAFAGPPELRAALEQNQAHPLSLAAADFDEDGVPDLITGYEVSGRGAFSLMRGNVDSIYPNEPEARQRLASGKFTHAPFLSPAFLFESPTAVDFVGAGDFDGDSHWDVVVASRSSDSLYLFSGNGKGGFAPARETKLPGVATAFVTGEINRSDGLTDIVVSINGPDGPSVLVFEGPEGALRSVPEHISLARPASALALAQLTDSYEIDLAVAAGHELQLIRGRDRKLSLDKQQQAAVLPLETRSRFFSQTIKAISAGDFSGSGNSDLAVLLNDGELQLLVNPDTVTKDTATRVKSSQTTNVISRWQSLPSSKHWPGATSLTRIRVSGQAGDDLAITDGYTKELEIWNGAENTKTAEEVVPNGMLGEQTDVPLTVLPMRLNADGLNDLVMITPATTSPSVAMTDTNPVPLTQTFVVNSAADIDDGVCNVANCTLREAINAANLNPGADTITFSIGTGVQTISPLSPLPSITEAVTLDATTQPGFAGRPIIELNGSLAGAANGLSIRAPNTVVRGFVINRFSGSFLTGNAIGVLNVGSAVIEGNYLGINVGGNLVLSNGGSGVRLEGGPSNNNRIGGSVPAARNVISGNESGITAMVGNGRIDQNVISGNYIGTSAGGTIALGNTGSGVSFKDSVSLNIIGGTSPGTRNIISGNRINVELRPNSLPFQGVLIQGNFIGTDVNGTLPLGGTLAGVHITGNDTFQNLSGTTVGGTIAAARNIISGNQGLGIKLSFEEVVGSQIQGNYIGTAVTGTSALGNGTGVQLELGPKGNTIGGSVSGARNIISGNINPGVSIAMQFGSVNSVEGNFIGTDFTGTAKLGNGGNGVSVFLNSLPAANAAIVNNVVSNNGQNGLNLSISPCLSCISSEQGIGISNNHIGTDVTNTLDMGNGLDGILLNASASSNTITQNAIAFNRGNGINIPGTGSTASVNNLIEFNSIFRNAALGINLGDPGVTQNDLQDPDVGGNTLQNFPSLTSINALPAESDARAMSDGPDNPAASTIKVNGTLNSTPNSTFVIQWTFTSETQCVNNQPQIPPLLFGKVPNVLTNANGDASYNFDFDFPPGINAGLIYATATNSTNNTSEYSGCFPIRATVPVTIETNPTGRSFSVDGGPLVSSTQVLNWLPGSTHAIATTSLQAGTTGQQFVWRNWSDSGSLSHSVTVPNSATTYTANFTTQYLLTMNAGSGGSTSPPNGFFDSGQLVQISAVPSNGFNFTGWTGSGSGSFSGSANPASVTMNGPITQTAAFTVADMVQFSQSSISVGEAAGTVNLNVTRTGNTSSATTVTFATTDNFGTNCSQVTGTATANCDFNTKGGTLQFAAGETSKQITVSIIDDGYADGNESFKVTLSNPTGVTLGSPSTTTVTIVDNDSTATNPFNDNVFFVREQYLDFLLREPDTGGFNFWLDKLNNCQPNQGGLGSDPSCDRVLVSSGFFRSTEFGEGGYWLYRYYHATLGRRPQFAEFVSDMRRFSGLTGVQLEAARASYIADFMQKPEFQNIYAGLTSTANAAQFIAKLEEKAQVTLPATTTTLPGQPPQFGRQELINKMSSGEFTAAQTLRAFIEQKVVFDRFFFRAFVAMQYFGYLLRDPEETGYNDWVDVLTNGRSTIPPGDFRHLIFGFVYSAEYRQRFGP